MSHVSKILIIAPHPDDEVLGCGGLIAKASAAGHETTVLTISGHRPPIFTEEDYEITLEEAKKAHKLLSVKKSIYLNYPAIYVKDVPIPELNGKILDAMQSIQPDILLIPYPDRNVDHRVIFDSSMVVSRPIGIGRSIKIVAAYETLSETHWNAPHIEPNFIPNWNVDITDNIDLKCEALSQFKSQIHQFPAPRSIEAIRALALFRGSQAGFGYGEGFHIIRQNNFPI
jgi:N-acetylglucosamine malate deacetylase 1